MSSRHRNCGVRDIESGTDDANELVRYLVSMAGGDAVALDLTVRAHGDDTIGSIWRSGAARAIQRATGLPVDPT